MNIKDAKIVPDLGIYKVRGICKETGRKTLTSLEQDGEIEPLITASGRRLLTFEDAKRLAQAL